MENLAERERRAADNQALFGSVNERIEQLNETFEQFLPYGTWTCECADTGCTEGVEMTLAEYETLRSHPNRFVVGPSEQHFVPELEVIVERTDRFWLIEKIGAGAARAAELSERHVSERERSRDSVAN